MGEGRGDEVEERVDLVGVVAAATDGRLGESHLVDVLGCQQWPGAVAGRGYRPGAELPEFQLYPNLIEEFVDLVGLVAAPAEPGCVEGHVPDVVGGEGAASVERSGDELQEGVDLIGVIAAVSDRWHGEMGPAHVLGGHARHSVRVIAVLWSNATSSYSAVSCEHVRPPYGHRRSVFTLASEIVLVSSEIRPAACR